MIRLLKIIGLLGFVICLLAMYTTDHGIPGIRKFDSSFRLLDMRFHYSSKTVGETFERIGEEGRMAYRKYLILDFIFIICFLITMLAVSDAAAVPQEIKIILSAFCLLRALWDVLENILLLRMLGQYPIFPGTLATICSWFTTMKFLMLYAWLLLIAVQAAVHTLLK